jgi:hypothetical protein
MNSKKILTETSQKLLKEVIQASLIAGKTVSVLKFRADNYAYVQTLDELESKDLLRRVDSKYVLSALVLLLVEDHLIHELLSDIERIYAVFQQRYKASPGELVTIDYVIQKTHLSVERIGLALPLMLETSLWSQGHSLHFFGETAYVTPSEGVLKYPKFKDTLVQILDWRLNPTLSNGFHAPLVSKTLVEESNGEIGLDDESGASRTQSLVTAWPAIRACLQELSFYSIKDVSGLAGLDLTAIADLVQVVQGDKPAASKGQLMSAIDGQFGKMSTANQIRFLTICAEEILRGQPSSQERLSENLSRLGWSFVHNTLIPIELFKAADLDELPVSAHKDLVKSVQRFRDGDLSGAISAACGAVDAATSDIYASHNLGDHTDASFQERCKRASAAKGVSVDLEAKLQSLGWEAGDIKSFSKNFEGSLNQGAFIMQTLRSHMGDVHGTKPFLRPLVFDALRWAELIVASLAD